MSSQNEFPWDTLRAETLRSIVVELGIPTARSLRKREGMVKTLTSVMENGLEKTIEECKELVEKEQPEDKPKEEGKPTRVSRGRDVGAARSTRTRSRKTSTFDGVVLDPGSKRNRRSSARANSSRR